MMNKKDLVEGIAQKAGLSKKDAESALNATLETIKDAMKAGNKVQLIGFGTFEVKTRGPRVARNPRTNEKIEIAACKVVSFKAGSGLKDAIK